MMEGTEPPFDSPLSLHSFYRKHLNSFYLKHLSGVSRAGLPSGEAATLLPHMCVEIWGATDRPETHGHPPPDDMVVKVDLMDLFRSCVSNLSVIRSSSMRAIKPEVFDLLLCNLIQHVQHDDEPSLEELSYLLDARQPDITNQGRLDLSNYSAKRRKVTRDLLSALDASYLRLWLVEHASLMKGGHTIRLVCPQQGAFTTYASTLAGALLWLTLHSPSVPRLRSEMPTPKCGDWDLHDIYSRFPPLVAQELTSFNWPIRSLAELERLLALPHAAPRDLAGGEFTGVVREENTRVHACVTLSVDLRETLIPGVHAILDLRLVLPRRRWRRVYLFPPCTHQTLSNTSSRRDKELDGRMFWGIAFFIYCNCTDAVSILIEQPDTRIPEFYISPTQRLRTSEAGCLDDKVVNFYERNRGTVERRHDVGGVSNHKRLRDFVDSEARDRWRSSWARFPELVSAVVAASPSDLSCIDETASTTPTYKHEIEKFAVAWFERGFPVPSDYLNEDAQPTLESDRAYQAQRGKGDGRRVQGVTPLSLRPLPDVQLALDGDSSSAISDAKMLVGLSTLTCCGFGIYMVVMQARPLVYAALDGMSVIGAELAVTLNRPAVMRVAVRMLESMLGARPCAFLAGEYLGGARIVAAPLNYRPNNCELIHTPRDRKRMSGAGWRLAWCTLESLAGSSIHDAAARAIASCATLCAPTAYLADTTSLCHPSLTAFRIGVHGTQPVHDWARDLDSYKSTTKSALERDWLFTHLLQQRLHSDDSDLSEDMDLWADRLQPPELGDVPLELLQQLPSFSDPRFDQLTFSSPPKPNALRRLVRMPRQVAAPDGACPRSAFDLLLPEAKVKLAHWLRWSLDDLTCIRDKGDGCSRHRPPVMVISQQELHAEFRGIVWDFRSSPTSCGVPLDTHEELKHTLNVEFFSRELSDYPNQRLLSMIQHGVRYSADVELQGVFIPHLTSLPKGFASVHKEFKRLHSKPLEWYGFHANLPFFPAYYNARGATPRKLEDRWRGTVEGGGPRKPTWDLSGLRVLSLNEASRAYHMPQHFLSDSRPQMAEWLLDRGLPATAEQQAELLLPWRRGTKWERQVMPTLQLLMRDLIVLRRAAHLLGEPVYLFGDDIKDFFMHMVNAAEEKHKHNVVWVADKGDLPVGTASAIRSDSGELLFISEERMGFGVHPNSGIAQELAEALLHIFRRRVDAVEDDLLRDDPRPEAQQWLRERVRLEERKGGHQRRLYAAHMYCDDSIVAVVGVERALRLLKEWRLLTQESGLIMAIPEKRSLGTWCLWVGILVFATLGIVAVPRAKLLRATAAIKDALRHELEFSLYQSLLGLLEHFRQAICAPRRSMHALYRPMLHSGEGGGLGPTDLVSCDNLMGEQLTRWSSRLARAAGAPITHTLRERDLPWDETAPHLLFVGSSDAATDSNPAGMGGWMFGYYWHLSLSPEVTEYLHITVLEMLASCFSSLLFRGLLSEGAKLTLQTDATAAISTLVRETERSEVLVYAHHRVLREETLRHSLELTDLGHLFGDSNIGADLASRSLWPELQQLAQHLRLRLTRIPVPPLLQGIVDDVLDFARARGHRLRIAQIPRPPADPPTPPTTPIPRIRLLTSLENYLDGGQSNNENRDAVLYVSIEGAIGVGKSTCMESIQRLFSEDPSVKVVMEPVDDWRSSGLLKRFYEGDMTSLEFQLVALTTLTAPILKWLHTPGISMVISERSPLSNIEVFAKINLKGADFDSYKLAYAALVAAMPEDIEYVTVYLDAPVEVVVQRVDSRGRKEEANIPLSLHEQLREHHEELFEGIAHRRERIYASASREDVSTSACALMLALSRQFSPVLRPLTPIEQALGREQSNNENGDAVSYEHGMAILLDLLRGSLEGTDRERVLNLISTGHGVQRPTQASRAAISLVATRLLAPAQLLTHEIGQVPGVPAATIALWNKRVLGTDQVQASLALLAMANPHDSERILRLASSGLTTPPRARVLTPVEQALSATQSNNENKDAVRSLVELLRGDQPQVTPPVSSQTTTLGYGHAPAAPVPRLKHGPNFSVPASKRMHTVDIQGVRFAAPSGVRKERPASARTRALEGHARVRAEEMATKGASAEQLEGLTKAIHAEQEMADYGAAFRTLDKDDRAWCFWERFCALYEWDPLISAELASRHPDQVIQRLGLFQAWVHPQLVGRGNQAQDAKPSTVFNSYALAVHRVLCRAHVPMPRAKLLEPANAGLRRAYKDAHGTLKLMPNKRQAMLPSMWRSIEDLAEGTRLPGRRDAWSPRTRHRDRSILRIGRILWRTGHRIGEICGHPSGEILFLTRSCVTLRLSGRPVTNPTRADWMAMRKGDCVLLTPCSSKCDQFGERWCPFPSVLPFDGTDHCAAAAVRDIELESHCWDPALRESTPLFADEDGKPFTYSTLHRELRLVLTALFGESIASTLSWHAIRIGLACALASANCPDAYIQLICRWASPASLNAYRQLGVESNISWTDRAFAARFDVTRSNNLPQLDDSRYAQLAAGEAISLTPPSTPPRAGVPTSSRDQRPIESFDVGAGFVQAYTADDTLRLIGKTVVVPNDFWDGWSRYCTDDRGKPTSSRTILTSDCEVVGECVRHFNHPDGQRCPTYLIAYDDCAYPIKLHAIQRLQVRKH